MRKKQKGRLRAIQLEIELAETAQRIAEEFLVKAQNHLAEAERMKQEYLNGCVWYRLRRFWTKLSPHSRPSTQTMTTGPDESGQMFEQG